MKARFFMKEDKVLLEEREKYAKELNSNKNWPIWQRRKMVIS